MVMLALGVGRTMNDERIMKVKSDDENACDNGKCWFHLKVMV